MERSTPKTREQILRAALGIFADRGYAAASVQSIVDLARVTKPTLYYHFGSKAGLFRALLDWAYDERLQRMQSATAEEKNLPERLVEIWAALFEFTQRHRALMRIAFATAFAAPGEIPPGVRHLEKGRRNFEFLHRLIRRAQGGGELDRRQTSRDLTMSLWGMMSIRVMAFLVEGRGRLTRREAEKVVQLFLKGAAPRTRSA